MKRFLALTLAVAIVLVGVPPLAAAGRQQGLGSINGTAVGGGNQPLAKYTVRVRNVTTGQIAGTNTTSATGTFSFTGLNPGTYVVEIVNSAGQLIGVTTSISVTAGTMVISGVVVTATAATAAGLAGAAAAGGLSSFFSSTAGILLIAGAGAGVAAGVITATGSPSK